jgi:predicted metal-dependent HD superfamily phosphohydrolase
MDYTDLLKKISLHVTQYMSAHSNPQMAYHTLSHTISVVRATEQIIDHYDLSPEDRFSLLAAAWFHDFGYYDSRADHEAAGASRAEIFLKEHGISDEVIARITRFIASTKMPQKPNNQLESIICDADLFHLGTEEFKKNNELMWREFSAYANKQIDWKHWQEGTRKLLENHVYHTDYCKKKLNEGKQRNLARLISEIESNAKSK